MVRDYRLALEWFRKSADQGNGEALAYLGHMHEKGLGVDRDIEKAVEFYKQAAALGHALGLIFLGDLQLNGLGIDRSPRKALANYQKAAEQVGDLESAGLAQLRMGAMHCQGKGVEKDLRKGFEFYHHAAKLGNVEAQLALGAMYRDGMGVERNHKKALEWFQKSARKNRIPAYSAMGDLYRDGLVVEKNIQEAVRWYQKAAVRGDKYAKTELLKLQQEQEPQRRSKAGLPRADKADGAKPAMKEGMPGRTGQKTIPQHRERKPKVPDSRALLYLFSAVGIVCVSLILVLGGVGKKTDEISVSLMPAVAKTTSFPHPGLPSLPDQILVPSPEAMEKMATARSSLKASDKNPLPLPAVDAAATPSKPTGVRLRREYQSLGEEQIAAMLTANHMYDAQRNPAGDFHHGYEAIDVAGLRVIVDRATDLVWTRQQIPVKMNLEKAVRWIESLNRVQYGGGRRWRLPTVEEAASLLQKGFEAEAFLPAIFGEGLQVIWTGDSTAKGESWAVDFLSGTIKAVKNKARLMTLMVSSGSDSLAN